MKPVVADQQNFYSWGDGCAGWRLLDLDHFQVRQEAMPPGTAEEPHMHRLAHQFFYVLSGHMTIITPEGRVRLAPGQGLHVPAGLAHWVRNEDPSELTFILSSAPGTAGDRFPCDPAGWATDT